MLPHILKPQQQLNQPSVNDFLDVLRKEICEAIFYQIFYAFNYALYI